MATGTSSLGGSIGSGGMNGLPAFPFCLALGEEGVATVGGPRRFSLPPANGGERIAGGSTRGS
eukprot:10677545-Alexandrium_andersonii.AAC.1